MYVPLQVGVFFLLLFFLKVTFACIYGMCSNLILQVFSFFFKWQKNLPGVGKSFNSFQGSRITSSPSWRCSSAVLWKFCWSTWKIKKFKYLDLQCLDMFHSNATYVKGLQEKYQKLKKNISKQRESFTKMQSYLYCILCSSQKCLSLKEV